jgi:hypothetical protein
MGGQILLIKAYRQYHLPSQLQWELPYCKRTGTGNLLPPMAYNTILFTIKFESEHG